MRTRHSEFGFQNKCLASNLSHKAFFAVVAGLSAAMIMVAGANAEPVAPGARALVMYDIPAQALDAALDDYIRVSGAQVFYETALAAGRRSTEVNGRFASEAALQLLLIGTGLVSRRADAEAFTVAAAPAQDGGGSTIPVNLSGSFLGALQAGVLGGLCRNPQTRPGNYKAVLELWISSDGLLQRTALIGSTGDAVRDAAVGNALHGVKIDAPLPAGTPQPLVMTIAPRPPSETGDCGPL